MDALRARTTSSGGSAEFKTLLASCLHHPPPRPACPPLRPPLPFTFTCGHLPMLPLLLSSQSLQESSTHHDLVRRVLIPDVCEALIMLALKYSALCRADDIFCYCDHQLQSFIHVPAAVADTGKNDSRSNRRCPAVRRYGERCGAIACLTTAFTRPHMQHNLYFRPLHAAAAEWRRWPARLSRRATTYVQ
ncbi:hypothetical protein C8R44DRAFT_992968, partial [Mycena epipterygia]